MLLANKTNTQTKIKEHTVALIKLTFLICNENKNLCMN